jgi:hypothetical protein
VSDGVSVAIIGAASLQPMELLFIVPRPPALRDGATLISQKRRAQSHLVGGDAAPWDCMAILEKTKLGFILDLLLEPIRSAKAVWFVMCSVVIYSPSQPRNSRGGPLIVKV